MYVHMIYIYIYIFVCICTWSTYISYLLCAASPLKAHRQDNSLK